MFNKLYFNSSLRPYEFNMSDLRFPIPSLYGVIAATRYTVSKYLHEPTNTIMAVKFIPMLNGKNSKHDKKFEKLVREVKIHQKLINHPNIVGLYGFCQDKSHMLLCMEFMDMSLKDFYEDFYQSHKEMPEELVGYFICGRFSQKMSSF